MDDMKDMFVPAEEPEIGLFLTKQYILDAATALSRVNVFKDPDKADAEIKRIMYELLTLAYDKLKGV